MSRKSINRSVLLILPKKPYYDWANYLFPEDPINYMDECSCYLLDDDLNINQVEDYLKNHYDDFFTELLNGMCTVQESWPEHRSWIMFQKWFDWHYSSLVWDLLPHKKIRRDTW